MREPIKAGDLCEVIDGARGLRSPNVGKRVTVVNGRGEHSVYGRMWRVSGESLEMPDGSLQDWADYPACWLKKIEPPPLPPKVVEREKELEC